MRFGAGEWPAVGPPRPSRRDEGMRPAGHRLSPRAIRIGSAALFAVAGAAVLIGAFLD